MFEKLLSILPYNPSLAHQLAFYGRRMRAEAALRRVGLVFMVLTFMIQFFAVLSPPQATVAADDNSLVSGGISSAADAKRVCQDNVRHYGDIVRYYGISCADIGNAPTVSLPHSQYVNGYFSMGHNPQGPRNVHTGLPTDEVPVNVPGAGTLYFRLLASFDSGPGVPPYTALKVRSSQTGKVFYILYNCGNLVAVGVPQPVQPCQYDHSLPSNSPQCIPPCQFNASLPSNSSQCFQPCQYDKNIPASSQQCFQPCQYDRTIAANSSKCFAPCPVAGKANLPQNSPQCFEVCPYNQALPASNPQCFQPCQYNAGIAATSPDCTAPCQFNSAIAGNSPQCFQPCQYNSAIPADNPSCFQPCPYNSSIANSDSACKPCDKGTSSADIAACISVHKTASNLTTGTTNADGTTANAGDTILYTLYASNSGKTTVPGFTFQENLSDVLDYADVADLHGGSIDAYKVVSWPAIDIAPNQTVTVSVTVTVKNPIPQTPADPSDPSHFDLIMTNVYGNTINIHVPGAPVKTIQTTTTALPNTGPGTSLFIGAAIVIIAGYFYGRARLLETESVLAVQETAGS